MRDMFAVIISTFLVYLFFVTSPPRPAPQPPTASQEAALKPAAKLKAACILSDQTAAANPASGAGEPSVIAVIKQSDWSVDCPAVAGIMKELEKANTEIQSRLDQEGQWFYLKYLFTGALTAAFLLKVFFKDGGKPDPELQLDELAKSPAVAFVLALATVVAISVDLQIVSGRMIIEQLGLWLKGNVEPALLHDPEMDGRVLTGWENFLWEQSSYHTSMLYAHTFWPNIFYITLLLYGSFIYIVMRCRRESTTSCPPTLMIAGYWLVHMTLLVATISSHYVPSAFEVIPFQFLYLLTSFTMQNGRGWPDYGDPFWTIITYAVLWVLLILYHWREKLPVFPGVFRRQ